MHLIKAGHKLKVYNRIKSKAEELIEAGATWVNSPQEAAESQEFICRISTACPITVQVVGYKAHAVFEGHKLCREGQVIQLDRCQKVTGDIQIPASKTIKDLKIMSSAACGRVRSRGLLCQSLSILRMCFARGCLISRWRGTGWQTPVLGF